MFIAIGILVVLVVYLVAGYNGFVVLKTRILEALSGIDVQLKRRFLMMSPKHAPL